MDPSDGFHGWTWTPGDLYLLGSIRWWQWQPAGRAQAAATGRLGKGKPSAGPRRRVRSDALGRLARGRFTFSSACACSPVWSLPWRGIDKTIQLPNPNSQGKRSKFAAAAHFRRRAEAEAYVRYGCRSVSSRAFTEQASVRTANTYCTVLYCMSYSRVARTEP